MSTAPPDSEGSGLRALFDAALALPANARVAFLRARTDDETLIARVLRMIDLDEQARVDTRDVGGGQVATLLPLLEARARVGSDVGRYRILAPLGEGGLGSVWRARRNDGEYEQDVAIKFIRAPRRDPALIARLAGEKQHLASLRHPYICSVLDAGASAQGEPWVAMELIDGAPLFAWADAHRLSVRARLELFRRILAAVGHAHAHLLIHCDIKSSNILVGAGGLPKLLDFGIARWLGANAVARDHEDAPLLLSPATAAPEQLLGQPLSVATDVWALGLLLYELLCGRPALVPSGADAIAMANSLRDTVPAPLRARAGAQADSQSRRGVSPRALDDDLDVIARRCLSFDPAGRYANVQQLDADIADVLAHRPIAARAPRVGYRLRKFARRHRVAVGLTLTLVLSLAIGIAVLADQRAQVAAQRNLALAQRDRAEAALRLIEDAFLAADPSQTRGVDTRIGEVLQAAEAPIAARAPAQPQLAASLYLSLAEVHAGLRSDEHAQELAAAARAQAERALSGEALLPYWVLHARTLIEIARFDEAQALLDRARAITREPPPTWYLAQSRLLSLRSESPEAVAPARRAVALTASAGPEDRLATAARWQLAEAQRATRDYAGALATLDETLRWQRSGAVEAPSALRTRLKRLYVLDQSGQGAGALREGDTLLGEVDQRFGPRSAHAAGARAVVANLRLQAGDRAGGIALLRETIEIERETLGPDHPTTILHEYNLALNLWTDEAEAAATEDHLRRALAFGARRLGATSNAVTRFRATLAQFLMHRRRADEALALLTGPELLPAWAEASSANREYLRAQFDKALAAGRCARDTAPACADARALRARLVDADSPPAS